MNKLRRREAAIVEGDWYGLKATRVWADIIIGAGMVLSAGASIYSANKQGQVANSQLGIEQDQQYKQDHAWNQLQDLMTNPTNFFTNPAFKMSEDQGSQAVARQTAASGFGGSGNQAAALQEYGQTFAFSQLQSQEALLAGMSGTGFNPTTAGANASSAFGAQNANMQNLAGMLSFVGNGMGGGGGGGGGGPTYFTGSGGT